MEHRWNSTELAVASDNRRTAQYRLLQSWYRQEVLGVPPGSYTPRGHDRRPLGSLLADESVAADPTLNFLGDTAVGAYGRQRARQVRAEQGALEEHRLFHNMLSSMPMCFNVFGKVKTLSVDDQLEFVKLFDPAAVSVEVIECEWTPRQSTVGDRTAFDAAVVTRRSDGRSHLIGVEAKYTEPFSTTRYGAEKPGTRGKYRPVHDTCGWFDPDAYTSLTGSATNQLWRNCLLAAATEMSGEFDTASVVVMALADDPGAKKALDGVHAAMTDTDRCRSVPLEALVTKASAIQSLEQWAASFDQRYIDLSPIS